MTPVKVLIIDDSPVSRQVLSLIFQDDPEIEVVGTAANAMIALRKIKQLKPDVLTLDVEMPEMDGITFLERLMKSQPMPVVMISSVVGEGEPAALRALELGAVDLIEKPKVQVREKLTDLSIMIQEAVKGASQAKVKRPQHLFLKSSKKFNADVILSEPGALPGALARERLIAIGASTGGTEAILEVLQKLPEESPGIVVVQHMPSTFTKAFARTLNQKCAITVREAEDGELVEPGLALIAPGDQHLLVHAKRGNYEVELHEGELVNRHRPSVDVLFRSVAGSAGAKGIGVILTGMGSDGAKGLLEMKEAGAYTIAQDEGSSVVFGMPKKAKELGAVQTTLSLNAIPAHILEWLKPAK